MVIPRPLNILVTRSFSITTDSGLTLASCSSDAQRGEYPDDTEHETPTSPPQAGPLEDCVTPLPEDFLHGLSPAPSTSHNHNARNDESLLDAQSYPSPSRVTGPNIPHGYCSHGPPSPPLSAVGSVSPPLFFLPDNPPPSPIEPLRRLSVQEPSKTPQTQSDVPIAHQNLAVVQFDEEKLTWEGTAPLHAIDLGSCEGLDDLVSGLFHCLQTGRAIQIIGVPFPDLGKWMDRLMEAGFWSIKAEFLPLGAKVGAVAYVNVFADKPATPSPTFWGIQKHDQNAESLARNHFISLAIEVLNNNPDRLPDLRWLISIDLGLRAWFEAELFQRIRNERCEPGKPQFQTNHKTQLQTEYEAYGKLKGSDGIPNVYYFGRHGLHNILILDQLGPSLEDLFDGCGRKFTLKTVVMIGKQMISIAEALHGQGLIHRDIKPENFLIHGPGSKYPNKISLIDPAMAENYRCSKTERHIPPCEGMDLVGTARYMSINAHLRKQQSRRDDLESIFYVLFYLMRGGLPWQGLKAPTKEDRLDKILEIKQQRSADSLCGTQSTMFVKCLEYVRELGFEQDPDYDYLKCCLTKALEMNGEAEDDRRHQREVKRDLSVGKLGVTSHNNLNIGCDRLESALKSYDKLLRALEYVAVLSEKASWEFLRKASSDDVVGLKTELNGVESLVEDCLKLVEQTDNATISISRTSFATSQDSELPLEVDEIYAHPGDETHQQTSTTFESRGGKGSRNEESQRPDTTQDKSHAQKRGHTTLSPGPRPHKRPSYESLSSRADDRWPHGDGG
ncbi:hypothetical protein BN1723_011988 [Verticillium longisporum]|uniref:non-specific serine/threonine protein kinase n=1 Tax=Verticillium longisporum TaxID=100787 RepID=A0A0G4M0F0_VERLO|nr:hypothetical protein BN1723_011988 [Verticillium longisporum]CRK27290.1 hypothetical protein BN1708_014749 [Verticillium longisporum]